ncbi:pantoate--beta-alanine ligase [Pustulibacterium marinum]|uniref:Pantothenate synthetase n=1 Tax=Pustulibacterium marinum TaxID=1224947 RepID=A0A1I7HF11_9FLAO|nr:pantoate--beta-alanine ligase [Pustulibacterium marinum]SFU59344.1 pantoate--beta-alanine ligase [Pustulibacterium marinum]
MSLYREKEKLQNFLSDQHQDQLKTGLVPTMGALHEGHISLIHKAVSENDLVVVSIFVNPTQFNNADDLDKYPRTLEADLEKINAFNDKVIVYAPDANDVYDSNVAATNFDFDGLEFEMEGKHRAGHFDGVGTIVKKLFEIVKPTNAYFGEKDFQQLQIIKKMVAKTQLPVNVIGCPILREANGLAMSSRNERLSKEMRQNAAFIFKTLMKSKEVFGQESITATKDWVTNQFAENHDFELEYVEIADEHTLKPAIEKTKEQKYRAFIAVYTDGVRLIDNIALN